jgi:hypothetical protein
MRKNKKGDRKLTEPLDQRRRKKKNQEKYNQKVVEFSQNKKKHPESQNAPCGSAATPTLTGRAQNRQPACAARIPSLTHERVIVFPIFAGSALWWCYRKCFLFCRPIILGPVVFEPRNHVSLSNCRRPQRPKCDERQLMWCRKRLRLRVTEKITVLVNRLSDWSRETERARDSSRWT